MKKKTKIDSEQMYKIVEKLESEPKDASRKKGFFRISNATTVKALRIHRHLKALEKDILDQSQADNMENPVSIEIDPDSKQIIISIHNDEVHCRRVAYLSPREFSFLRKNPELSKILRKHTPRKNVA